MWVKRQKHAGFVLEITYNSVHHTLYVWIYSAAGGGSKVRGRTPAAGRWFSMALDTSTFPLIKRCDLLISGSSNTLTFRLIPFHYNPHTLSLKHLVVVNNYWCHPDSCLDDSALVPAVRLTSIIKTLCELILKKKKKNGSGIMEDEHVRSPAGSRATTAVCMVERWKHAD